MKGSTGSIQSRIISTIATARRSRKLLKASLNHGNLTVLVINNYAVKLNSVTSFFSELLTRGHLSLEQQRTVSLITWPLL